MKEERNKAMERETEKIKDLPKKDQDSSLTEEQLGGVAAGMREGTGNFGASTNGEPETSNG
jgi:hypothetical protein